MVAVAKVVDGAVAVSVSEPSLRVAVTLTSVFVGVTDRVGKDTVAVWGPEYVLWVSVA